MKNVLGKCLTALKHVGVFFLVYLIGYMGMSVLGLVKDPIMSAEYSEALDTLEAKQAELEEVSFESVYIKAAGPTIEEENKVAALEVEISELEAEITKLNSAIED